MEKRTDFYEAGEPETELWKQLKKRNWTVTTVESCTGGAVAARIVNVAGASEILRQAFVTYCDEAKHLLAGVRQETLEKYTAVSRETAREMALGGARAASADVALSVTGLAGPGGGTPEKPVGLVYIGLRGPWENGGPGAAAAGQQGRDPGAGGRSCAVPGPGMLTFLILLRGPAFCRSWAVSSGLFPDFRTSAIRRDFLLRKLTAFLPGGKKKLPP